MKAFACSADNANAASSSTATEEVDDDVNKIVMMDMQ